MFWIIFAAVSFTTLVVSWGMMLWFSSNAMKEKEFARKNGFCPDCGAPLLIKIKARTKKQSIGFKV